jgi:hypothetical protein
VPPSRDLRSLFAGNLSRNYVLPLQLLIRLQKLPKKSHHLINYCAPGAERVVGAKFAPPEKWRRATRFIAAAEILRLKGLLIQHTHSHRAEKKQPPLPPTNLTLRRRALHTHTLFKLPLARSRHLLVLRPRGFATEIRQHGTFVCTTCCMQYSKVRAPPNFFFDPAPKG